MNARRMPDSKTKTLSPAKRRLVESRVRGLTDRPTAAPTIPQRPADLPAPLAAGQHGVWLLHQVDPASAAYNLNAAYRVEGVLDPTLLQSCLDRLTERHAILRTRFESGPEGAVQVIEQDAKLELERSTCAEGEILATAGALAREPWDLQTGPLLRMHLIGGDGGGQLLLLSSHHVILDEWSLRVLWRELATIYEALARGRVPELPPLPIQFADYAAWQQRRLADGRADRQLDFWRQRLAKPLQVAAIPTDRPRTADQSERGGYLSATVDSSTVERLRQLASREAASLSMVLLLAWKLLLQRYTDSDDILVGSPVADRQLPETERLLGYLLNTTVLRTDLGGEPTVREALGRVRQTMLEAFENRDLAFDELVRRLNPTRSDAMHPYFQSMFVFQRRQDAPETLVVPGATLEPIEVNAGSAKLDLTLFTRERQQELLIMIEFRRELFDETTIERLLAHYRQLLASLADTPDLEIGELSMLTTDETSAILRDWQGRDLPLAAEPLLGEVIATQASEHADSIVATSTDGRSLTYAELRHQAAAVKAALRAADVQPGEVVALHLDRSPEATAGIVGIFWAGAAYLPIDPDYPTARRRYMLEDAGVRLVVTDEAGLTELEPLGLQCLLLPEPDSPLSPEPPCDRTSNPQDLAYVIYTSGSTGQPKGVAVTHGNLRASNRARTDFYSDRPGRYLLIPSLSFDSSIAGIFWVLSTGGTLVLPSEQQVHAPEALAGVIEEQQVTHLLCIPSLYRALLDSADPATLQSLRTVIVAGEACPADLVALHHGLLPEVPLFNEYGPTEATVWATVHRCDESDLQDPVPIGQPVANTQVHILDRSRRPVPPGIAGEIYISGAGVAEGYLGRDDLTRERFIDLHLPGSRTASRCYATGDLGRWRGDGRLEFLGRRDEQIKLSGFRIEPAEIEGLLRSHPGIEEAAAVVVSDRDQASRSRLVAYYLGDPSASKSAPAAVLRRFLAEQLPRHMVPTTLIQAEDMPRQPNGKLDRQALVDQPPHRTDETVDDTDAGPIEIQLMRIWLELLDDPSIGRQSNFFEHGGHSLLIPTLIERVRQDFAVDLPLGAIFEAPTVEELAAVIEAGEGRRAWRSLVSIRTDGNRTPLYVIHGLAGEISYFYNLARHLPRDRPVFGVQAPAKPLDDMVAMASRYLEEIRQAQPHGPYLLVGYCLGGCIAFEMARQLRDLGEEIGLLVLVNSVPPRHLIGDSVPLATILARRLKRFTSKGPRQMLASLTNVEAVKRHLRSGVRGDKESAEESLDELTERMHPAYQEATVCHYRAMNEYHPQPYPGDAWLFRGSDLYVGADLAWRQIIQGRLEVEAISGHHQYVLKEPNVQTTAEKLARLLDDLAF